MDFCKPYAYIIYDQKHITRETDLRHLFAIMGGGQERQEGCCLYAEKNKQVKFEMQDREGLEMGSKVRGLGKENI